MAALHSALTALAPTSDPEVFSSSADDAKAYLQSIFRSSQIILDSVPPPLVSETSTAAATPTPRPRSSTVTSSASSVSASSARSDLIDGANANLQKEWGKPIKLAAKDNPYNIAVYKLSGKDGKGAWFARRSVHEGMGFRKWKIGLQREFPESLAVQGGPGEGNVRGIGAERKVCSRVVEAIGQAEGQSMPRFEDRKLWADIKRQYITYRRSSPAPLPHGTLSSYFSLQTLQLIKVPREGTTWSFPSLVSIRNALSEMVSYEGSTNRWSSSERFPNRNHDDPCRLPISGESH